MNNDSNTDRLDRDPNPAEIRQWIEARQIKSTHDMRYLSTRKRAFKKWITKRRRDPLLKLIRQRQGPNTCKCGQRKPCSCARCYACADTLTILKRHYKAESNDAGRPSCSFDTFSPLELKMIKTAHNRQKPQGNYEDDSSYLFDDLARVYENTLEMLD